MIINCTTINVKRLLISDFSECTQHTDNKLQIWLPKFFTQRTFSPLFKGLSYSSCTAPKIYDTTWKVYWGCTMQLQAALFRFNTNLLGDIKKKIKPNHIQSKRINHLVNHAHCYSVLFTPLRNTLMSGCSVTFLNHQTVKIIIMVYWGTGKGWLYVLPCHVFMESKKWRNSASYRIGHPSVLLPH